MAIESQITGRKSNSLICFFPEPISAATNGMNNIVANIRILIHYYRASKINTIPSLVKHGNECSLLR